MDRATLHSLYPDTSYSYESGGNPDNIPELSYEEYLDFHRKYYHPSNSYILSFMEIWIWLKDFSGLTRNILASMICLKIDFRSKRNSLLFSQLKGRKSGFMQLQTVNHLEDNTVSYS